jgi:pimeloyl-ACP methyl ester carboxylesterase
MSKRRVILYFQILVFLILLQAVAVADKPPGIPDGWSDGYVYANGIRIHYYHAVPAPGKPVIVMIHGITDIGLFWATLTWKLQSSYDIYMPDTRGHGLSDPFTATDDSSTLVKDVVEFVHAMHIEKPILLGHSMGAATVMHVGAEYPGLAKAIIMLDPFLRPVGSSTSSQHAGDNAPSKTPQREASDPGHFTLIMFGTPEALVAQNNYSFDDLVATCRRQSPKWDIVDCKYWALSKKQYHGAYTSQALQVMSGVMRTGNALAKITAPALILKADAPPEVRKANEAAASVMQNGKLVHIDGAGHNLHHDELERTVKVLVEFLSNL